MSITNELREYANKVIHREDYMAGLAFDLNRIADRIDKAIANKYVRLPKDADGVPIEIGDYLHCDETGKDFPCRGYCCSIDKDGKRRWTVECSYDTYSGTSEFVSARRCHHYHEPTVEDVLREFFSRYVTTKPKEEDDAIVSEYAEKLREAIEHERD